MRILIVHSGSLGSGVSGETVVAKGDYQGLKSAGADVIYHEIPSPPRNSIRYKIEAGTATLWSRGAARQIRELVDEYRPDIVHFHSILPSLGLAAISEAKRQETVVVQTLHNARWICVEGAFILDGASCMACMKYRGLPKAIQKGCAGGSRIASSALIAGNLASRNLGLLNRWVDAFVAVSNCVADVHIKAGFPASKLHVRYNPLQLEPPQSLTSQRRGVVVFAGRLGGAKGADLIPELARLHPDLEFLVFGVGPLEAALGTLSIANLRLLGSVPPEEVLRVQSEAFLTISPSRCFESFGMTAAQSYGLGVPAIVSNVGGLAELAQRSGAGLAVNPTSAEFSRAITTLVQRPSMYAEMSASGLNFARSELSSALGTERLLAIYDQVLSK